MRYLISDGFILTNSIEEEIASLSSKYRNYEDYTNELLGTYVGNIFINYVYKVMPRNSKTSKVVRYIGTCSCGRVVGHISERVVQRAFNEGKELNCGCKSEITTYLDNLLFHQINTNLIVDVKIKGIPLEEYKDRISINDFKDLNIKLVMECVGCKKIYEPYLSLKLRTALTTRLSRESYSMEDILLIDEESLVCNCRAGQYLHFSKHPILDGRKYGLVTITDYNFPEPVIRKSNTTVKVEVTYSGYCECGTVMSGIPLRRLVNDWSKGLKTEGGRVAFSCGCSNKKRGTSKYTVR